jgi:uncharacterized protein YhaN
MKLTEAHVDGFGVWTDLTLAELSPHCTVFYGPNEAGKSTLLQFIRAVLYGFSPARTARYLPPLHSATAGGFLTVSTPDDGRLHISRHENAQHPLGSVKVEAADGTVQNDAHLNRLLHDVDETMFQNVFAVGLQELQELGTLTESEAARWLYVLTAGLDRVSLCDVLTELENSRRRLWSDQPASQIGQLLSQRSRLHGEVLELSSFSQQLGQLVVERTAAEQQIAKLESVLVEQEAACRKWETVAAIHGPWQRRRDLIARLETFGPAAQWPPDAVSRMNRIAVRIQQSRRKKHRVANRHKALAHELRSIKPNPVLARQAVRIDALAENESWIMALEQEIRQAEETVKRLSADRQTQQDRLNGTLGASAVPNSPQQIVLPTQIDQSVWRSLRRPAAALSQARLLAHEEKQKIDQQHSVPQRSRNDLEQALAARGQKNLTAALETAGQRVAQLRRRIQLDELIEQLAHNKIELEQSISGYLERQILPLWMLLSLGGIFVLGVVLILGGLLLPGSFTGSLGWPMAWLGLLGVGSAVAAKYTMERSAANQLEASRRQLALIESQTKQADSERTELDRTLPKAGVSLAARLQTAQQELAKLEELLPLDAQRQSIEQASQDADARRAQAEHGYQQALDDWQTALTDHGLPDHLMPSHVRAMFAAAEQRSIIERQLTEAQSELDRRRRESTTFSSRLAQVFSAAEMLPQSNIVSEQLRQLRRELSDEETRQKQRELILLRQRKLRRHYRAAIQRLRRLRNRRKQLLRICHATDLADFRRRSAEFSQIASLTAQRDSAAKEISSLLANYAMQIGSAAETEISALVGNATAEQLASQLAESRHRLDETRRQQRLLFEECGRRNEQFRLLSGDRRLARKRFELAQVEQRLAAALSRWQTLTLTHRWLELIKQHYERHRQPETLREASEYLTQMTGGRYRRVWTRWGDNVLLVDDSKGRTLTVEVLSRGTLEQLFLSLRLALVSLFARRGVELPMVLDDVLVNFDADRAAAAIQVLHDFSRRGHQLLIFTCHEHLARLFKRHRMDVRRLPSEHCSGRDQPFLVESPSPPQRSRTRRLKEENERPQAAAKQIPAQTPPAEPPILVLPLEPMRLDSAEQVVRLSPIIRRWAYWQEEADPSAPIGVSPSESELPKPAAVDGIKKFQHFEDDHPSLIIVDEETIDQQ